MLTYRSHFKKQDANVGNIFLPRINQRSYQCLHNLFWSNPYICVGCMCSYLEIFVEKDKVRPSSFLRVVVY